MKTTIFRKDSKGKPKGKPTHFGRVPLKHATAATTHNKKSADIGSFDTSGHSKGLRRPYLAIHMLGGLWKDAERNRRVIVLKGFA